MKKLLIVIVALGLLSGCTVNNRETAINFSSGTSMRVDASGAVNRTDTDQKADGDFSGALDAAKAWLEGNLGTVVEQLKKGEDIVIPVVPKEDAFVPAEPTEQGELEVIE